MYVASPGNAILLSYDPGQNAWTPIKRERTPVINFYAD